MGQMRQCDEDAIEKGALTAVCGAGLDQLRYGRRGAIEVRGELGSSAKTEAGAGIYGGRWRRGACRLGTQ